MSSQTSTKKDTVEIGNSKTLESSIPKPLKTPSAKEPAKNCSDGERIPRVRVLTFCRVCRSGDRAHADDGSARPTLLPEDVSCPWSSGLALFIVARLTQASNEFRDFSENKASLLLRHWLWLIRVLFKKLGNIFGSGLLAFLQGNTTLALFIIIQRVVARLLFLGVESVGEFLGLAHVEVLQLISFGLVFIYGCIFESENLFVAIKETRSVVSNFDTCKVLGSILNGSSSFSLSSGELFLQLSDFGDVLLSLLLTNEPIFGAEITTFFGLSEALAFQYCIALRLLSRFSNGCSFLFTLLLGLFGFHHFVVIVVGLSLSALEGAWRVAIGIH
ncbi:hypothetical protein HG531_006158 [Fusarium graminearum]|nr:hypothetical protein HG531_006158 [Fusarium graminearum]